MTENPAPENTNGAPEIDESLSEEFRNLGKNIAEAMRTAWDNPERKRLQQEIQEGLSEFGSTLKNEVEQIAESPTAQQFKADVQDVGDRIRSGEVQNKVRHELIAAIQSLNNELQKVIQQWSTPRDEPQAATEKEPAEADTQESE